MNNYLTFILSIIFMAACQQKRSTPDATWIPLFNGQDLSNWTPKFTGFEAGVNYKNTFRVVDGILLVSYSEYDSFNYEFGHLFTNQSFENYRLKATYRFVNPPIKNAPDWAFRNNGFMLHAQAPSSMLIDQDFPISLEAQPLGGRAEGSRSTMNLCTPGTHVTIGDSLVTTHCISSSSKTYRGDEWVNVEMIVYGDSIIHHVVEGDTVLTYANPVLGGDFLTDADTSVFQAGNPLSSGHIAIQAESHDTEFQSILLMELKR